jgi:methenyltetrahydromethanopterin cyclohydrolase
MQLNQSSFAAVEALRAEASRCRISCHEIAGVQVIDCGVDEPGGHEAGLAMARAAMGGLGDVQLVADGRTAFGTVWPDCPWPAVTAASDQPIAACLAAQYAGWKVAAKKYFAMASGPIRAAIGREELFDHIGLRERPAVAVGLLESAALPPAEVCLQLAADAGVPPEAVTLLVARTASLAGTLQIIARSLETGLHKLHDLGFDLGRIRRGRGVAPLAPVPTGDDLVAIGRTNDAILYGGHVVLEVTGDDASLAEIGPRMVSSASASYGDPFMHLFEQAGRDFYALDPALFAPALVDLVNVDTGTTRRFGALAPEIVARSFGTAAAGT